MNTLSILCCIIDWQPVIKAIPCICWSIILLVALYLLLKHVVAPIIANYHELNMKKEVFIQELYWANRTLTKEMVENLKLSPDEWLKNQMKALTENIDSIAKQLASEKEKEEKVKESLELKKKAYEEMLQHISTVISIEKKQEKDKKNK